MARDVNVGPAAEKKLERYGVWVKVEPRDVTRDLGGGLELTDLDSPPAEGTPSRASFTDEEEHLLDELETGVGHEVAAGTRAELESLDEQLPTSTAEEELPELELEDAVEVPLADARPGAGGFDDLPALEDSIASPSAGPANQPEVLSRIELELRSIRSDLSALKKELAVLRRPGAAAARAAGTGSGAKTGFFEEEDDDTIALTGDELDNILNTADITEEAAEAVAGAEAAAGAQTGDAVGDLLESVEPDDALEIVEPVEELEEIPDQKLETTDEAPPELVLEDVGTTPVEAGDIPALDLDVIPEIESVDATELEELPSGEDTTADKDLMVDLEEATGAVETDLKGSATARASGDEAILSTDDLAASDLAELEAVAEEPSAAEGEPIEIDFEQAAAPARAETATAEAETVGEAEAVEEVEDLEEAVEALEEPPAAPARPAGPSEAPSPSRRPQPAPAAGSPLVMNETLKNDLRNVLGVIDELLDALPEKKIREFAKSEHFAVYRKLFDDLGLSKPE